MNVRLKVLYVYSLSTSVSSSSKPANASSSLGLCVVRIMLYAQEGNGTLLSFNQPCTIRVNCRYATTRRNLKSKHIVFCIIFYNDLLLNETCYTTTIRVTVPGIVNHIMHETIVIHKAI